MDIANVLEHLKSITQDLQGVTRQLSMTPDANNQGLNHVCKMTEIHAKVQLVSMALLESQVDVKSSESSAELIRKLNLEVKSLEQQVEKAKAEVKVANKAKSDECASVLSLTKQLGEKNALLEAAELKISSQEEEEESESESESSEEESRDVEELELELENAKEEASKMTQMVEWLNSDIATITKEKNKMKEELQVSRDAEEKSKKKASTSQAEIKSLKLCMDQANKKCRIMARKIRNELWTMSNSSNPVVFLDISIDGARTRRIFIELFADVTPRTAENFRALCTGEKGIGDKGKPLHYKGCYFYRLSEKRCNGGDITHGDGTGGDSIYGKSFSEENFIKKHNKPGVLSMGHNVKDDRVSSRFCINYFRDDNRNGEFVVFGQVVDGMDVVEKIRKVGTRDGEGTKEVQIADCGQLC